ncbi:TonB-dependent receptor domain-containing protein [Asticcacaulis endophyticus]|uniref:TonB-dependent receptor domain-containing protein n=1 Tax=Asticcacaulis endophyticus TaxID=1395890 RepID=UPI00167307D2|nr:TonB-dependent receptor [Asticcacaulis endophyticus]
MSLPAAAYAQTDVKQRFDISPQPLGSALAIFTRVTGLDLVFGEALPTVPSGAVRGEITASEALSRLLAGTGLTYRIAGNKVTLEKAPGANGAIQLGTIRVESSVDTGRGDRVAGTGTGTPLWDGRPESVYTTPGSVSVIEREQIDAFRGTSPADILKSAPGILSGESRANGGIDVNIRGLQGQGRVVVTVDGAQNSTNVYRGYQGIANRTFIDPDFISSVSIEKGSSGQPGASGAIGGTLTLRTVTADDIVGEGEVIGIRMKAEYGGNTSPREQGRVAFSQAPSTGLVSTETMPQRPSDLDLNTSAYSMLVGTKSSRFDTVFGYSHRRSGNYHAGEEGSNGSRLTTCPYSAEDCAYYNNWHQLGLTAYLSGEEVLNTSQDAESFLLKGTLRITDSQTLDLGFSRYDSHYGETFPGSLWNNQGLASEYPLSEVLLDTYTARYRWDPVSELIDLKFNLWGTEMTELSISSSNTEQSHKWGKSRGADVSNTSSLSVAGQPLNVQYGLSYLSESTGPDRAYYVGIPPREGSRKSASLFVNTRWEPLTWLTVTNGLRYQNFESENKNPLSQKERVSGNGTDISLAASVRTPVEGLQAYVRYDRAHRLPSLFESVGAFATTVSPDLKPERSNNWELGLNAERRGMWGEDEGALKLSYFRNQTDDYIYRQWTQVCAYFYNGRCYYYTSTMVVSNLEKAEFTGWELSGRYRKGGFAADLNATYYDKVAFCRTENSCKDSSLAADYATNQVPPEYSWNLTLSQKLLKDRLNLSARVNRTGPRAAKAEPTSGGANPFIALIDWKPYTVTSLYADYAVTDGAKFYVSAENVFDEYYVEPLGLALMPSPGRTLRFGLTAAFNGPKSGRYLGEGDSRNSGEPVDWNGLYVGLHGSRSQGPISAEAFGSGGIRALNFSDVAETAAGVQFGYNYVFADRFVVGPVLDYSAGKISAKQRFQTEYLSSIAISNLTTAGIRLGIVTDRTLVYVVGGRAVADTESQIGYQASRRRPDIQYAGDGRMRGTFIGAGAEYALGEHWSFVGEYRNIQFERGDYWSQSQNISAPENTPFFLTLGWEPNARLDQLKIGLNYRF